MTHFHVLLSLCDVMVSYLPTLKDIKITVFHLGPPRPILISSKFN